MNEQRGEAQRLPSERIYLTKQELVARSGLSSSTIQRYKRDRKIPFFQPGGQGAKLLFPPDAVEAALLQSRTEDGSLPQSASTSDPVGFDPTAHTAARAKLSGPRPRWQSTGRKNQHG